MKNNAIETGQRMNTSVRVNNTEAGAPPFGLEDFPTPDTGVQAAAVDGFRRIASRIVLC
jgi:hypothetical protein